MKRRMMVAVFLVAGCFIFNRSVVRAMGWLPPSSTTTVPFSGFNLLDQGVNGSVSITTGLGSNAQGMIYSIDAGGSTSGSISNFTSYPASQYTVTVNVQGINGNYQPIEYTCQTTVPAVNNQFPANTQVNFTIEQSTYTPACSVAAFH